MYLYNKQINTIKKKSKGKKKCKGKGKDKDKNINQQTQEGIMDQGTERSLPGDNIRNRNEEIHKAAKAAWELGQALGMSACDPNDVVQGLFADLVERD